MSFLFLKEFLIEIPSLRIIRSVVNIITKGSFMDMNGESTCFAKKVISFCYDTLTLIEKNDKFKLFQRFEYYTKQWSSVVSSEQWIKIAKQKPSQRSETSSALARLILMASGRSASRSMSLWSAWLCMTVLVSRLNWSNIVFWHPKTVSSRRILILPNWLFLNLSCFRGWIPAITTTLIDLPSIVTKPLFSVDESGKRMFTLSPLLRNKDTRNFMRCSKSCLNKLVELFRILLDNRCPLLQLFKNRSRNTIVQFGNR